MRLKDWLIYKWTGYTPLEIETLAESYENRNKINIMLSEDVENWKKTAENLQNELARYKSKEYPMEHKVKIVPEYLTTRTFRTKVVIPDSSRLSFAITEADFSNTAAKTIAKDLIANSCFTCSEEFDPVTLQKIRLYELKVVEPE